MSSRRIALLVALLPIAALHLSAQQPPNPAPPPAPPTATTTAPAQPSAPSADSSQPVATLHVTSRLVVLDVVVTDGYGNPAHGLKPSDFTLTEDGVPQSLASFTEHGATGPAGPAAPLPPNTFAVQPPPTEDQTKTVIVLADPTSWDPDGPPEFPSGSVANTGYVRNDITAFLKTAPSTEPVAIVRMDWQGTHLVQDLTADRDVLMQAIASKRMEPPLGFVVRYAHATGSPTQQLVHYINSIPGRVNLVCITYGGNTPFGDTQNDFPDLSSIASDLNGSSNVLRLSRVALYLIPLNQADVWANSALEQLASAAGGHAYFIGVTQALTEIAATGADYYTISYVPTNPNWNGAFRTIKVSIAGFPQPPPPETWSSFWSVALGWTELQKSKVLYRPGYYARSYPDSSGSPSPVLPVTAPAPASARRMISYSPRGDPNRRNTRKMPETPDTPIQTAMDFGTPTPDQLGFTIAVTPLRQIVKPKPGTPLPQDNYLAASFQGTRYRNYRIHYWIDPKDLKFTRTANGSYRDDLEFVAVVYRDDGLLANSASITAHIQVSANNLKNLLAAGVTFDQTLAIPIAGNPLPENFFLRVGVSEASTGHIGALEIPTAWIKLPSAHTVAVASKQAP